jgi:beta-phosphoglucomutase-like phosphatase (HAD superfamily)
VASNSVRKTVDRLMELADLSQYLDFTLSNEDVARPKPDPEIYLAAAEAARVPPGACVVVEDNHYGVQAATSAGARVLRVHSVDEVTIDLVGAFIRQHSRCAPARWRPRIDRNVVAA